MHLVLLSLHGLSLQNLSHKQTFSSLWKIHFQMRVRDQIIYVLIRHAWFLEQVFKREAGMNGARLANLWLVHIITKAVHHTIMVVGHMSTAVFAGLSTLHGTAWLTPMPYCEP